MAQQVKNPTSILEDAGSIPGLHQLVKRIWRCHKLRLRLKMQLGSGVAVAVVQAGSCSSDLTPSLELSHAEDAAIGKKKMRMTGCDGATANDG